MKKKTKKIVVHISISFCHMLWNCKILKLFMDKMNEYDYWHDDDDDCDNGDNYDCDRDDDGEDDDHNPAQWL